MDEYVHMHMPWHTHGIQMINLGAGPAFFADFLDAFTGLVDLQASKDAPKSTSYPFVELWDYRLPLCVHSTYVGCEPQLRPSCPPSPLQSSQYCPGIQTDSTILPQ